MKNKRAEPNRRKRKPLTTPIKRKPSLTEKTWFRGASVLSTFAASTALIYSMAGSVPANAISPLDITGFLGSLKSVIQSDSLSAAFRVNSAQTARYPSDVARHIFQAEARSAAIISGEDRGRRIAELQKSRTPHVGFSDAYTCSPHAERTATVTGQKTSEANAANSMMIAAGTYSSTATTKKAARTFEHLSMFCDSSEMSQGLCMSQPNGLGGADSNYATITANSFLTPELEQAAYAFMLNVTNPASTEQDVCNTVACETLKTQNRVYQALSSMSQNAFINQINDSKIYQPAGADSGKTPDEVLAEQKKEPEDSKTSG